MILRDESHTHDDFVCESGTKRGTYFCFSQEYDFVIHCLCLMKTPSFIEDVLTSCDLTWQVSEVNIHSSLWEQCEVTKEGTHHHFLKMVIVFSVTDICVFSPSPLSLVKIANPERISPATREPCLVQKTLWRIFLICLVPTHCIQCPMSIP